MSVDPEVAVYQIGVDKDALVNENGELSLVKVHLQPKHHEDVSEGNDFGDELELSSLFPILILELLHAHFLVGLVVREFF